MAGPAAYDALGIGYRRFRQPDPWIAERIETALGDSRTVLNVGAGTGSYEPPNRDVTALEPSAVMLAQRPRGAAPAVQASAEAIPFPDNSFDAAMALVTIHHWSNPAAGLAEMRRVARRRVIVLTFDARPLPGLWFTEYFPRAIAIHVERMGPVEGVAAHLPGARLRKVPVPRRCRDCFFLALWARPEMLLMPAVRCASSVWHDIPAREIERDLGALRADLANGAWKRRHGSLRRTAELDVGMRLLVSEPGAGRNP